MMLYGINLVPVILAAISSMVIGSAWYSPAMFGNQWMKLMKFDKKAMAKMSQAAMAKAYGLMLVSSVVMAYVLTFVIEVLGAKSLLMGAQVGLLMFLGFVVTSAASSAIFGKKPFSLFCIDMGFYLVQLVVMGMIISLF